MDAVKLFPFNLNVVRAVAVIGFFMVCSISPQAAIDVEGITLPAGFRISVYTDQVPNARSLALGEAGTVYVGTNKEGKVYAVRDENGDGLGDRVYTLASGLNMPNGVAYLDGALYVAELSRIVKFKDIGRRLSAPPIPETVYDSLPNDKDHGWKYLRIGPDRKLYTAVGAPCDICQPNQELYATLVRLDLDGKNFEIFARGVRNTVGFDWEPKTRELWFTENGRNWLGDDAPPDELNHAPRAGLHFGFPYCHGKEIADPRFGRLRSCAEFVPPAWTFAAHVAVLGARFYTGGQFPAEYRGQLFVAEHGSSNRSTPQGFRVVAIKFEDNKPVADSVFAEGWLRANGTVIGRPVDILQMPDGALLVSDDRRGAIYRITYQP
jgi:glucose/arabinose dehydrogenase